MRSSRAETAPPRRPQPHPPPTMPSSAQLPPELVADVLDIFLLDNPSHVARRRNLASFAAVSRRWFAVATPLLYRKLYLDSRTRSGILAALEKNEALVPLVRELSLSGGGLDAVEYERLKHVLARCGGVERLGYHCFNEATLQDLTRFVSTAWPGLKYLRADQSAHLFDLLSRLPALETLIASYIEFPAPDAITPTPSPPGTRPTTPTSIDDVAPVRRPTFRLKRLDSGSSPLPAHFHLLTSSSAHTLRSLDLPLSSLTSQDLSAFASLERLTLTLAERYLPLAPDAVGAPAQPPQRAHGARDDARLMRRVRRVLDSVGAAGSSGVSSPLRTLEVYEPAYAATASISRAAVREGDLWAGVPSGVERLELATVEGIEASDVVEAFGRGTVEGREGEKLCCVGVRELVLGRKVASQEGAAEMLSLTTRRGVRVLFE
ncbi:hypothetical protein JCM8208_002506 [Rhodotorula glutinis]